jgi:predicted sulfurtransferase
MGEKMVRIFEIVMEQAGLIGRMELATRPGISQTMAAQMKDTEELVKKLKENANLILDRSNLKTIGH